METRTRSGNTVKAVLSSTLGSICLGNVLAWPAVVLHGYDFWHNKFPELTNSRWIICLPLVGAICSAPLAGFLVAKIGQRKQVLWTSIPLCFGWALIAFAPSLSLIYLGRFITGFCAGSFTVSVPTYIAEVSEDKIRGKMGVLFTLMMFVGILLTFALGIFVSWTLLTLLCACVPCMLEFFMLFMPDSPRHLVKTGQTERARTALKWLRQVSNSEYVDGEIAKIEKSISTTSTSKLIPNLFTPRVMKPVGICVVLFFLTHFGGMNVATTKLIFISNVNAGNINMLSVIFGVVQILSVLLVPFLLVERWGRRGLLLTSEIFLSLSFLLFAIFFALRTVNERINTGWFIFLGTFLASIGVSVGIAPVSWVYSSEILQHDVKEWTVPIVSMFYWLFFFVYEYTLPNTLTEMGYKGVYFLYFGICLAGAIFVFFFVPETKGKSCEELQNYFESKPAHSAANCGNGESPKTNMQRKTEDV